MRMFPLIVFAVAMLVAGNAAYFSVKGIGLLFAGSFLSVIIMASSLEVGKLVAASFLYRKWDDMKFLMKSYLTAALGLLMVITSLGIYGFLSDAYQDTKTKVELYQSQIDSIQQENSVLTSQIKNIEESKNVVDNKKSDALSNYKSIYEQYAARQKARIDSLNERIKAMDKELQTIQEMKGGLFSSKKQKLKEAQERQAPERKSIADELEVINKEIEVEYAAFLKKVDGLSDTVSETDDTQAKTEPMYAKLRSNEKDIMDLKSSISETDIGSFKFIANAFDIEVDTAVKWFIFIIVIVFDPLAVCLVIGYNMLIVRQEKRLITQPKEVDDTSKIGKLFNYIVRGPAKDPRTRQEGR